MMKQPIAIGPYSRQPSSPIAGVRLGLFPLAISLWMITTFAAFRTRPISELLGRNSVDEQVLFQAGSWLAFGGLAAILVLRGFVDFRLARTGPLFWYVAFSILALFSAAYSVSPTITAYSAAQLLIVVALALSICGRLDAIYKIIIIYAGINWLLVLLGILDWRFGQSWIASAPEIYARYGGTITEGWRFTSAFGHPSQISIVAAIGAVGLAARSRKADWKHARWSIAFLTLTVLLTVSRTAIVGMIAGFIVVAWYRRKLLVTGFALYWIIWGALCLPAVQQYASDYFKRGQSSTEFLSLTGRVDLYSAALKRAGSSVFGEGFRALRERLLDGDDWGHGVAHAHNFLLQSFLELGYPGALLAMLVLVTFAARSIKLASAPAGSNCEYLAVLPPIVAFSFLDSGFTSGITPFLAVFIAFLVRLERDAAQATVGLR